MPSESFEKVQTNSNYWLTHTQSMAYNDRYQLNQTLSQAFFLSTYLWMYVCILGTLKSSFNWNLHKIGGLFQREFAERQIIPFFTYPVL